jgi:predicted transcriptional regulator
MPELHAEIMMDIDNDLMDLYEEGMVEIEYDEDLNAMFRITEKGKKIAEELGIPPFPLED